MLKSLLANLSSLANRILLFIVFIYALMDREGSNETVHLLLPLNEISWFLSSIQETVNAVSMYIIVLCIVFRVCNQVRLIAAG